MSDDETENDMSHGGSFFDDDLSGLQVKNIQSQEKFVSTANVPSNLEMQNNNGKT